LRGLDLHSGLNILKQLILEMVGKPSDLVLSHPPYHNIVVYSGNVWGRGHILTILLGTPCRAVGWDDRRAAQKVDAHSVVGAVRL